MKQSMNRAKALPNVWRFPMSRTSLVVSALLSFSVLEASATALASTQQDPAPQSPVVVGGGSSLAAPVYAADISAFGPNHIYAVTGSGVGKASLLNSDPNWWKPGESSSFNAAYIPPRTDTIVHYAGSDSVLSSSEIGTYNANRQQKEGNLLQIPSMGVAIGIPFKKDGVTSLTLNDHQLCGVFSGKITDWSQITSASGPITVVYDRDSSGTTEIFTRHLNAVCWTGASGNSNVAFVTSTKFEDSFPTGYMPPNFVGVTLSEAMRDTVAAGNAIGYLSPPYISTKSAPLSTVATQNLQAASLLNSNNGIAYQPWPVHTDTALSNFTLPTLSSNLADPNTWALTIANPTTGYPIVGLTYLDHVQCYADATVLSKIQTFLDRHTTYSGTNSNAGRILGNGFARLPSGLVTLIRDNLLNNVNGKNANIGNATACAGKAGR
ncbi:substrate-binding domain-containing protein [Ralstonia sp. A12]|uniref:substrate-binding domain-containing protein n=1 Tax=Ralstonia sp. A12 TaxID=1217052 RepID=UPI000A00173A|nr:substrate-binding domain-containing protein [Ralstonia sp. A12]